MGLLIKNDANIYKSFFKEMSKLIGIKVLYQYIIDNDYSIHSESVNEKLSEPIELDIIFHENPKVSTLRKLGWLSEKKDDKPYIIQVPHDTPNLRRGCQILIQADMEYSEPRRFRITEISSILEYPDSYLCKVAPEFNKEINDKSKDYSDSNYNFIKRVNKSV